MMNNMIDTKGISKNPMEIIKRGGKITYEELHLLVSNFPSQFIIERYDMGMRYTQKFYLEDIMGYAFVGVILVPDVDLECLYTKEEINNFFSNHPIMELEFGDLSLEHFFDSYKELEIYRLNFEHEPFDPRNDYRFEKILSHGSMTCKEDYDLFEKYITYVYHSNFLDDIIVIGVIVLSENEICLMELEEYRDVNMPYKPFRTQPTYKNDFIYKCKI